MNVISGIARVVLSKTSLIPQLTLKSKHKCFGIGNCYQTQNMGTINNNPQYESDIDKSPIEPSKTSKWIDRVFSKRIETGKEPHSRLL